jgi:hypothetical protein
MKHLFSYPSETEIKNKILNLFPILFSFIKKTQNIIKKKLILLNLRKLTNNFYCPLKIDLVNLKI